MGYIVTNEVPPACLPDGLSRGQLVDITVITDSWRRYLDPATGEVHDGAVHYERACAEIARDPSISLRISRP